MPDLGQFLAIIRTLFWHVQPVEHWRGKNSMGNIEQKRVMCPERDKRHTWFNKHQHPIVPEYLRHSGRQPRADRAVLSGIVDCQSREKTIRHLLQLTLGPLFVALYALHCYIIHKQTHRPSIVSWSHSHYAEHGLYRTVETAPHKYRVREDEAGWKVEVSVAPSRCQRILLPMAM